jgi:calcium-dependent protein kinase
LQIIVELLSGEEVDGLRAMFDLMDINNKGFITFDQFKNGLRKLGSQLSEQEIRQLMDAVSVIDACFALLKSCCYKLMLYFCLLHVALTFLILFFI